MARKRGTASRRLSRDELIVEANMQTRAIGRLMVWQRLGYSAIALGVLLGWWGLFGSSTVALGVVGVVLLAVGAVVSAVLHRGIKNAKMNVHALMRAAGIDVDRKEPDGSGGGDRA